ncbi:hypothetical protein AGLY_004310 [Aphis glycines]|uniref:Uncharacterized protein n=1 Tax=Aphis glycines TaxID=307491 RepID=A0A6G0TXV5_APHGL|nr:hypothetical protein AGLY_004310 [Aphis glycines]
MTNDWVLSYLLDCDYLSKVIRAITNQLFNYKFLIFLNKTTISKISNENLIDLKKNQKFECSGLEKLFKFILTEANMKYENMFLRLNLIIRKAPDQYFLNTNTYHSFQTYKDIHYYSNGSPNYNNITLLIIYFFIFYSKRNNECIDFSNINIIFFIYYHLFDIISDLKLCLLTFTLVNYLYDIVTYFYSISCKFKGFLFCNLNVIIKYVYFDNNTMKI